ncbi:MULTISPECIES: DUF4235 domain-containing protein [Brachybacterium]|uniref:DUF4235 domain-containing protein n=1 Tax=Brachybacterium epidermidis TaxID=2781983 RepID=A0ABR9W3G2_9MICO|nr:MULTISPECIES: DUF4235 domain-containing protein [Brachybacterium]PZP14298.1 MAG: hypothetical protein DI611_12450 [Brachybacterium faecium]MBE9404971.1 DUF4235 domain-containing protein [Brachybacterium epidermidis]MCT1384719.1 DUF4235 domain-containing protein [Brachybacterium sp. p3-SID1565]MCT1653028.1 DUF4235 domain-containing protein [Brachybacterium muris]MCT1776026.1 DUF4235 domain-containing protein [Brachybacterium sp. p3-SID957]
MAHKKTTSTSAKVLYRPVGILSGVLSGALAGIVFKQVWKKASPKSVDDAPSALQSEFPLWEILAAAALQGALYATIKALMERGGARAFERVVGEWPGD